MRLQLQQLPVPMDNHIGVFALDGVYYGSLPVQAFFTGDTGDAVYAALEDGGAVTVELTNVENAQ